MSGSTEAAKARQRRYRLSKKGQASEARYRSSDKGKANQKRYLETDAGKATRRKSNERAEKLHPNRIRARMDVRNAERRGDLVRPDKCENDTPECKGRIEAHHSDYSKPLDVNYFCAKCHVEWHRNNEPINQGY